MAENPLRAAFPSIDPRQADALWLRASTPMTYREIGDIVGVTGGRAQQLVYSATRHLIAQHRHEPGLRARVREWPGLYQHLFGEAADLTGTCWACEAEAQWRLDRVLSPRDTRWLCDACVARAIAR